jgi:hypothetical protein
MPRGRFLNKEICLDKTVNELSSDLSKLAFTWIIPHLDKEGRIYGDPAVVRSMIFPRRTDITVDDMQSYIQEWHDAGLIVWYECNDDKYILFPNFDKHQVGLNKDREADSVIPAPDELMTLSGSNHEQIPVNIKLSKDNANDKLSELEDNASSPPNFISEFIDAVRVQFTNNDQPQTIKDLVDDYGEQVVLEAATWYGQNNPRNMGHALKSINTVLSRGWNTGNNKVSQNNKVFEEVLNGN